MESLLFCQVSDVSVGMVLGRSAPYSTEAGDVAMSSVIAGPIPARYAAQLGIARAVRL